MDMCARQFQAVDFDDFDLIVALDRTVYRDLLDWPNVKPEVVRLARSFDPLADSDDVADPYYGGLREFEEVTDILERICGEILNELPSASAAD